MVGEASGRMQKADCRDEIALPAAMLAWLKYRKQRTRNSRKRFLVFLFFVCKGTGGLPVTFFQVRKMDCFQGKAFDKLYNSNVFFCKQQLSHFQQGRHA